MRPYLAAALAALLVGSLAFGQAPASQAVPRNPVAAAGPGDAASAVPVKADAFLIGFQPPAPAQQFKRGLHRTPAHKYAAAPKFQAFTAPPPSFGMIPKTIHMWGNDQYGDCVSAQECCSMVAFTTYCGQPVIPTDAECIAFARKYGLLNGANLDQVMDIMSTKGMVVGGKVYKDGPYATVDYSNPTLLQSALTVGPVNVAIDADALPRGAGNQQGWYAFGGQPNQFPNTDHCITFLAYGTVADCYKFLSLPVPTGVDATKQAYVCDTWNTLGVVDQAWVMSTMAEAWVRNPTTVGFTPPTPLPPAPPVPPVPPVPPTPPVPVPPTPSGPFTGSIYYQNGVIIGFGPLPAPPTTPADVAAGVNAAIAAGKVNPLVIFMDALQIYTDYQAKNYVAVAADVAKLIADLGIGPAPTPPQSAAPAFKATVATLPPPRTPVRTAARVLAAPVIAAAHWTFPGVQTREGLISHLRASHRIVGQDILEYLTYEELLSWHDASHTHTAFNCPNLAGRQKVTVNVSVAAPVAQPVYQLQAAPTGGCPGGVCPPQQQRGLFNFGIFR